MKFEVRELARAQQDIVSIFEWIRSQSPKGAEAWLDAYDQMLSSLRESADGFPMAPENDACSRNVQQALFRTRKGNTYRALFFINGEVVYILRVRGFGQAPVDPQDLQ